jgi:hypothetical protein
MAVCSCRDHEQRGIFKGSGCSHSSAEHESPIAYGPDGHPSSDQMVRQKEHLPSVSSKEQRMYEHIKASEQTQDRSTQRAKAIAAATVVKQHNEKRHAESK